MSQERLNSIVEFVRLNNDLLGGGNNHMRMLRERSRVDARKEFIDNLHTHVFESDQNDDDDDDPLG